jgi:hypothetical protein
MIRCRPEDWPNQLEAHLTRWRCLPFIWGKHDCAHFVAEWAERMGYPHGLAGIPEVTSPLAAARLYKRAGGWIYLIQQQMAALGIPEIPLSFTGRGDISLVWIDAHRQALGIANGRNVEILTTEGVVPVRLHPNVARSWRL